MSEHLFLKGYQYKTIIRKLTNFPTRLIFLAIGVEEISLDDGDFYTMVSLDYPFEYPNNVNYSWIFTANVGRKVIIRKD